MASPAAPELHVVSSNSADLGEAIAAAEALSFKTFLIDMQHVSRKEALFTLVAEELRFPKYFGRNWDALLDHLSDLSWWAAPGYLLVIENSHDLYAASGKDLLTFLEVVRDAAERLRIDQVSLQTIVADAVPKFELETAVGVNAVCDHRPTI